MVKQKLTRTVLDHFLEKVKAGTAETKVFHDTLEPGLTVRANKDTLSYRYLYRNEEGVLKPLTLGKYLGVEPDVARKAVRKAKGEIVLGTDVQAEKQKRRQQQRDRQNKTLSYFLDNEYADIQAKKKSGTATLKIIQKHFKHLGNTPMDEITVKDVMAWEKKNASLAHDTLVRTFGALKTCLNTAVKLECISSHKLEKHTLERKYLSEGELSKPVEKRRPLTKQEVEAILWFTSLYCETES